MSHVRTLLLIIAFFTVFSPVISAAEEKKDCDKIVDATEKARCQTGIVYNPKPLHSNPSIIGGNWHPGMWGQSSVSDQTLRTFQLNKIQEFNKIIEMEPGALGSVSGN